VYGRAIEITEKVMATVLGVYLIFHDLLGGGVVLSGIIPFSYILKLNLWYKSVIFLILHGLSRLLISSNDFAEYSFELIHSTNGITSE
jgi:hypothetical protein